MPDSADPRPWVPVDADLWQQPGKLKLPWHTRKVAIYLRFCAGPRGDEPHVALRSLERMATDLSLSVRAVARAIERLRSWPSRRKAFIRHADQDEGMYILRPVTAPFIRAYRWLWEFFADDVKDILLFVRSRFTRKTRDGEELFDMNIYGTKQPSIRECCYLAGAKSKERSRRLKEVVETLIRTGLVVVADRSSRNTAMVVRLCDTEPIPLVQKAIDRRRGNGQTQGGVTAEASWGNGQTQGGVTAEASWGNDTPEYVPQSVAHSVESESAVQSAATANPPIPDAGGSQIRPGLTPEATEESTFPGTEESTFPGTEESTFPGPSQATEESIPSPATELDRILTAYWLSDDVGRRHGHAIRLWDWLEAAAGLSSSKTRKLDVWKQCLDSIPHDLPQENPTATDLIQGLRDGLIGADDFCLAVGITQGWWPRVLKSTMHSWTMRHKVRLMNERRLPGSWSVDLITLIRDILAHPAKYPVRAPEPPYEPQPLSAAALQRVEERQRLSSLFGYPTEAPETAWQHQEMELEE